MLGEKEKYGEGEEYNSAFYTPVPTVGTPTDVLANRFQGSFKQAIYFATDFFAGYPQASKMY